MNNSRADKRAMAGTQKRVILCSLPALLFLLILGQQSLAQNRSPYDINDPRNPDCPCHQQQKLADEEYERQQRGQNKVSFNINLPDLNADDNSGWDRESQKDNRGSEFAANRANSGPGMPGVRSKKKKPGTMIRKRINRSRLKHSKIKWQRPDYSVCYKW